MEDESMATGEKKGVETAGGYDLKMVVLIAAAALIIGGGAVYLSQQGSETQPPVFDGKAALASPQAKLLLSSFDARAKLSEYGLSYKSTSSSGQIGYSIKNDGDAIWISQAGAGWEKQGFFQQNGSETAVCIKYGGKSRCAVVGNNSDLRGIAADLKSFIPAKEVDLQQKLSYEKHIAAGAILFYEGLPRERVGAFDAIKLTYALNYRNLSIRALNDLGVSPDDPAIRTTGDYTVSYWVDNSTGLLVKSKATYLSNGAPGAYEEEYSELSLGAPAMPAPPSNLTDAEEFLSFYRSSEEDYRERAACLSRVEGERDICFASLAFQKNEPALCGQAADSKNRERCYLIMAQTNANASLCEGLSALKDECYISVAGERGDFALCRLLSNQSLGESCNSAATAGQKKMEEKRAQDEKLAKSRNCAADADCAVKGSLMQYCVPGNQTVSDAAGSSPVLACYEGLPCSCNEGFCGFRKNETFYQCVNEKENAELEEYIKSLQNKNGTSSTGN